MGLNSTHSFIFFIFIFITNLCLCVTWLVSLMKHVFQMLRSQVCVSRMAISGFSWWRGAQPCQTASVQFILRGLRWCLSIICSPRLGRSDGSDIFIIFGSCSASPSTASPSAAFVSFTSECGTYTMVGTAVWLCGGYNTCSFFAAPWFNPGCSNLHVCCWWWLLTSPRLPFSKLLIYLFKQESQISWTIESTDFASFMNT